MKTIAATALFASTLFLGAAYAQSPAPHAADTTMKSDVQRNQDVEKHIVDLHAQLKITSAEESQWNDVAQAMRDNAKEVEEAIDKRADHGTAIDDLNAYGDIVQAHADGIRKLAKVFSSLYASMSDSQKKVADEVFVHHGHDGKNVASH